MNTLVKQKVLDSRGQESADSAPSGGENQERAARWGLVSLTSSRLRCMAALAASRWAAYEASSSSLNFSSCKANCA